MTCSLLNSLLGRVAPRRGAEVFRVAPTIRAVVGGDVVYNQVHMMTAETDEKGREDWIASHDQIAALQPRIVVSGHKRVGAANDPKTIGESQQYLRDFSRVVASEQTVEGIVSAMLALHPGPRQPARRVA